MGLFNRKKKETYRRGFASSGIRLVVQDSYPYDTPHSKVDANRRIVRLSESTMFGLDLSRFDYVVIAGNVRTVARCILLNKEKDECIIRMDALTRANCGVNVGDTVEIKKIHAYFASSIQLALFPTENPTNMDASDIKSQLDSLPIIQGDNIMIEDYAGSGGWVLFQVLKTNPSTKEISMSYERRHPDAGENVILKEKFSEPESKLSGIYSNAVLIGKHTHIEIFSKLDPEPKPEPKPIVYTPIPIKEDPLQVLKMLVVKGTLTKKQFLTTLKKIEKFKKNIHDGVVLKVHQDFLPVDYIASTYGQFQSDQHYTWNGIVVHTEPKLNGIGYKTAKILGIEPGDCLLIEGNRRNVAMIHRTDITLQDGEGWIYLNQQARINAGVSQGDFVSVKKAKIIPGSKIEKIIIEPLGNEYSHLFSRLTSFKWQQEAQIKLREHLNQKILSKGDKILPLYLDPANWKNNDENAGPEKTLLHSGIIIKDVIGLDAFAADAVKITERAVFEIQETEKHIPRNESIIKILNERLSLGKISYTEYNDIRPLVNF